MKRRYILLKAFVLLAITSTTLTINAKVLTPGLKLYQCNSITNYCQVTNPTRNYKLDPNGTAFSNATLATTTNPPTHWCSQDCPNTIKATVEN